MIGGQRIKAMSLHSASPRELDARGLTMKGQTDFLNSERDADVSDRQTQNDGTDGPVAILVTKLGAVQETTSH